MADHKWFRHDVGTMADKKMQRVLRQHGIEGIGIYWFLVESLYREDGLLNLSDIEDLSFTIHADVKKVKSIVIESGLFECDKISFWSSRVLQEINYRKDKSEKARKAVNTRWEKNNDTDVSNTNEEQLNNDSNTDVSQSNNDRYTIYNTLHNNTKEREKSAREHAQNPPILKSSDTPEKIACGQHKNVLLSKPEYKKLTETYGTDNVKIYINKVSAYMRMNSKSYSDHYATIMKWLEDDITEGKIHLPIKERNVPLICDTCGKPLDRGVCRDCNRGVFEDNGKYVFEDMPDLTEMASIVSKMRSFA